MLSPFQMAEVELGIVLAGCRWNQHWQALSTILHECTMPNTNPSESGERFIVDNDGNRVAVILQIEELRTSHSTPCREGVEM